jgi:hypothetical protein
MAATLLLSTITNKDSERMVRKKYLPFLLWFYDLMFSNQILTHRPCHDSYLSPQAEHEDTTFIFPNLPSRINLLPLRVIIYFCALAFY